MGAAAAAAAVAAAVVVTATITYAVCGSPVGRCCSYTAAEAFAAVLLPLQLPRLQLLLARQADALAATRLCDIDAAAATASATSTDALAV